ncbi:unnamed protein product, partial [Amoebophrya sp. A25]
KSGVLTTSLQSNVSDSVVNASGQHCQILPSSPQPLILRDQMESINVRMVERRTRAPDRNELEQQLATSTTNCRTAIEVTMDLVELLCERLDFAKTGALSRLELGFGEDSGVESALHAIAA